MKVTTQSNERTKVLYNSENIIKETLKSLAETKQKIDLCADVTGPSIHVTTQPVWRAFIELCNRGIKFRFITEITKENLFYSREIMKIAELRHLDGVKGNFGIADERLYHASATTKEARIYPQFIVSTVKAFVEQQQYLFNMLWIKAIPANQRIREIEEGIIPDFIETKSDADEIRRLELALLKSAKQEILITFPTTSSFHSHKEYGVEGEDSIPFVQLLKELSNTNPQIRIKIITPSDYRIDYTVQKMKEEQQNNIAVQFSVQPLESTVLVLVIDREFSLSVEVQEKERRRGAEENFEDVRRSGTGLATYSNSKSTVLSYASIFETLWKQAELYDELKKSKTQLLSAQDELEEMKRYVNEALREVGRVKNKGHE